MKTERGNSILKVKVNILPAILVLCLVDIIVIHLDLWFISHSQAHTFLERKKID